MSYPEQVKIVEVGPRDGLQNESVTVPAEIKVAASRKARRCRLIGDRGGRLRVAQMGAADGDQRRGFQTDRKARRMFPTRCWCPT